MIFQVLITEKSSQVLSELRQLLPVVHRMTTAKMTTEQTEVMSEILDKFTKWESHILHKTLTYWESLPWRPYWSLTKIYSIIFIIPGDVSWFLKSLCYRCEITDQSFVSFLICLQIGRLFECIYYTFSTPIIVELLEIKHLSIITKCIYLLQILSLGQWTRRTPSDEPKYSLQPRYVNIHSSILPFPSLYDQFEKGMYTYHSLISFLNIVLFLFWYTISHSSFIIII